MVLDSDFVAIMISILRKKYTPIRFCYFSTKTVAKSVFSARAEKPGIRIKIYLRVYIIV